jgi:hypothetical protein
MEEENQNCPAYFHTDIITFTGNKINKNTCIPNKNCYNIAWGD